MSTASAAAAAAGTGEPGDGRILLVDDRPDKLLALESVLVELRIGMVQATSGKDALRLLLNEDFAVILLDVNMPVMDGFETAQLIRSRERSRHTPIIFISAINSTDTHAARGYSLGAVDYIFAPVVPEILRAKISVFIDLYRKSQELARKEALFRSVFDEAPIGMAVCGDDGRFLEINRAFCAMLGRSPEQCLELSELEATHAKDRKRDERALREAGAGQVIAHDKRYARPDGSEVWASVTTIRLSGEGGGRGHRLVMAMDISERRHIRELEVLTDELQRSNADLEQFAYIASHDLQEPLRMVSSYCSLLASRYRDRFDTRGQGYLDHAVAGALRMHSLIQDLLGFSRAGKREPACVRCDCGQLLDHALENLCEAVNEAGAEIERGDLPTLSADPVLLGQLFQNLVGNALKFRPRDGARPRVRIAARRVESGAGTKVDSDDAGWEFAIADNGIGIAPEHHQRIFGVFQRLHTREEYPGTGIGLALCRKVVERHGGRIWVDSATGSGATFRFTIPDRVAAATPEPLPQPVAG